jgi:hypothetical protein
VGSGKWEVVSGKWEVGSAEGKVEWGRLEEWRGKESEMSVGSIGGPVVKAPLGT